MKNKPTVKESKPAFCEFLEALAGIVFAAIVVLCIALGWYAITTKYENKDLTRRLSEQRNEIWDEFKSALANGAIKATYDPIVIQGGTYTEGLTVIQVIRSPSAIVVQEGSSNVVIKDSSISTVDGRSVSKLGYGVLVGYK